MTVQNPNVPVTIWQFAPSTGANTGAYPTVWYDLTSRALSWSHKRGKQRELGIAEAGEASLVIRDPDQYLNPLNASSPFNTGGNSLKLYRPIRHAKMPGPWNGNMLNTGNDLWLSVRGNTGSYADSTTFEGGTIGGWKGENGVTITNSSVRAHDGTKSGLVTWSTGASGVAFAHVPIPPLRKGYTYTLSMWVWIVSGPAVSMQMNTHIASSTTTTGVWQQIVLTQPANDGDMSDIYIFGASATTAGQTVFIDSIQLEYANSVGAFTTTGPKVFSVFTGNIERYPNSWKYAGYDGYCQLTCTDALGMFPRVSLEPALHAEMRLDRPTVWWPFDDANAFAGNYNIHQYGTLQNPNIKEWGGGSAPPVSSIDSSGDRTGPAPDNFPVMRTTCGYFSGSGNSLPTVPDDGAHLYNSWTGLYIGGVAAVTVEIWFRLTATGNWTQTIFLAGGSSQTDGHDQHQLNIVSGTPKLQYIYYNSSGTAVETINSGTTLSTGVWYHAVVTMSSNGTTLTSTLYLNAVSQGTASRASAIVPQRNIFVLSNGTSATGVPDNTAFDVGYKPFWGDVCELAVYQGVSLSSSRISAHYTMGVSAYNLDHTGQRLLRILNYAGWIGPTSITTSDGVQLGTIRGMGGVDVGSYLKTTTDSDQGLLYCDAAGRIAYIAQSTIAASTPIATFGEDFAGGEIPYRGDDARQELEPSNVYNQITVTPYGLPNADLYLLDVLTSDATSQTDYGIRTLSVDALFEAGTTGGAANQVALAAFLLAQKKDPHVMVTNVTVPVTGIASNALWAKVLALDITNCVTWKRRATSANAGAGVTISVNTYVQTISLSESAQGGCVITFDLEPQQV